MTDPRPNQNAAASPLSEERVREYAQMLAAVTPGPWATHERCESPLWFTTNTVSAPSDGPLGHRVLLQLNHYFDHDADARFIAASPTIVAELLADRTALTARLEAVERDAKRLDWIQRHCARFWGAETCAGVTRTSIKWEIVEYELYRDDEIDDERVTTVEGDFRAAVDAAMAELDALFASRCPAPNHPSPART